MSLENKYPAVADPVGGGEGGVGGCNRLFHSLVIVSSNVCTDSPVLARCCWLRDFVTLQVIVCMQKSMNQS